MGYFDKLDAELQDQAMIRQAMSTMISKGGSLESELDAALDDLLEPLNDISPENESHHAVSKHVPVSTASASASEQPYSFPVGRRDVDNLDPVDLVQRMSALVVSWQEHHDYMRIRDEYCGLALAMNHEGLQAPAFRPSPTIPFLKNDRTETDNTLHKDRVVIECHWLRCRNELVVTREEDRYQPLFDVAVPFSFDLASSFACENWSNKYRADEALYLTPWQQCQLTAMQGDVVNQRRKAALGGIGHGADRLSPGIASVRRTLRTWGRKVKSIVPQMQAYENLWLARALLDKDATVKDIATLAGFISGTPPLDESTVRGKLKLLDKRMSGGI